MTQQDHEGAKKIVLMGLDNSGKTSITLSLMSIKTITKFCSLTPTRMVDKKRINKLETEFSIWDFGGQEQFRKNYVDNFEDYLKSTDKFIYVIDIQDIQRYDQALDYLLMIIALLEKIPNNIEFSIFLHKFDPGLFIGNKKLNENLVEKFITKLKEQIPLTFNYNLFKTSIYTIFQKSKV